MVPVTGITKTTNMIVEEITINSIIFRRNSMKMINIEILKYRNKDILNSKLNNKIIKIYFLVRIRDKLNHSR
jgi:hypothetical protein